MFIPGRALWPFAVLERAQVKHAVKSGVAAALAVLGHQLLPLPDKTHPAWAARGRRRGSGWLGRRWVPSRGPSSPDCWE